MSTAVCDAQHPTLLDVPAWADPAATEPVRVLHLINGEHYSGAERVQDLLALNLGGCGYEVGFGCLKPGRFDRMRQAHDAPLVDVPMHNRVDLRPAWQVARLVREQSYALIHTHAPRAALVGA